MHDNFWGTYIVGIIARRHFAERNIRIVAMLRLQFHEQEKTLLTRVNHHAPNNNLKNVQIQNLWRCKRLAYFLQATCNLTTIPAFLCGHKTFSGSVYESPVK